MLLPKLSDPRLHLSTTFVFLYLLGEFEFSFRVSIPQIFTALLTCGLIEFAVTFWRKRVLLWPASALLTGNGIAFIMRIPGTRHGDWWSTNGLWIYASVGIVSLLSKYLIQFRGKHVFNPSNFGLVLAFLVLGSQRTEPLEFWWGPTSIWLILVLGTIVSGALLILSRLNLLVVAAGFWATFAAALGVLALSGHAMSAHWHLGPVSNGYFWRILVASPEVFIFLSFMITDPRTVPETRLGRRVYAVSIGLLGALLIAPQQTEFQSKVALLGSLTLICAARPLIILLREAAARSSRESILARLTDVVRALRALPGGRAGRGVATLLAAASFALVLVLAGTPARSSAGIVSASGSMTALPKVTVAATSGVVAINRHEATQIASDVVADLHTVSPAYRVAQMRLSLEPAQGQAPPTVVAMLTDARHAQRTLHLVFAGGRFQIVRDSGSKPAASDAKPSALAAPSSATAPKGTSSFAKLRLVNVAQQVGLNFQQGAFRFGMSSDPRR